MEQQYFGYIYMTTNLINGMKYIGKRKGLTTDNYLGSGKLLQRAINKYGKHNFKKEILEVCVSLEELNQREVFWIDYYKADSSKEFYNIVKGGDGGDWFSMLPQEQQEQLRREASLRSSGSGNGMYGKSHSEETKKLIAQNKSYDTYKTDEYRQKMSGITSGENNGMYGKSHSELSKQKMSTSKQGMYDGEKNPMYGKKGENAINGKKLYQYADAEFTQLIKEHHTVDCALGALGIKGHSALYKAIRNKRAYKGYYWSKEKSATTISQESTGGDKHHLEVQSATLS